MEKAENADVQNLQNAAGDSVASPNTRRRLLRLKAPKLHIKIPFLKRSAHLDNGRECRSADVVSQSLPAESYMPKMCEVELYHDCSECSEASENLPGDHPDSSTDITKPIPVEEEDEADSDKHQSDLDENEKDNEEESKENGQDENVEESEKTSTEEVTPPSTQEGCLKPCLKVRYHGRRRASTYPGPMDCLEASFKRCVTFSPDTVEPTARDCKYREWMEKKCLHPKSPKVNIKHEKRKCQLNQMRKVNISDYMSKGYGSSFFNPIGSYGGDMLL